MGWPRGCRRGHTPAGAAARTRFFKGVGRTRAAGGTTNPVRRLGWAAERPAQSLNFHNFTVLSAEPEAIAVPSGLKATDFTAAVWPFSTSNSSPAFASQTRTVLSSLAVTTHAPSGWNAT